jgi:hypothetical protein
VRSWMAQSKLRMAQRTSALNEARTNRSRRRFL